MDGDAREADFLEHSACCPVEDAILLIGGKWKLLLLRMLLVEGPMRFNALLRALAPINQKVLTQNLRELEGDGLLRREEKGTQHVDYALTPKGQTLHPILHSLGEWAAGHSFDIPPPASGVPSA